MPTTKPEKMTDLPPEAFVRDFDLFALAATCGKGPNICCLYDDAVLRLIEHGYAKGMSTDDWEDVLDVACFTCEVKPPAPPPPTPPPGPRPPPVACVLPKKEEGEKA